MTTAGGFFSNGWHDQQNEQNRDNQKAIAVVPGFSG
jgi:hypothetical protein